jgi:cytochrome P450
MSQSEAALEVNKKIPSLPGLPILGNLLDAGRDRLSFLMRVNRECGDIGQFRIGPRRVVQLNSPEYVQVVLVDNDYAFFEKSPVLRRYLRPVFGNGLLSIDSQSHKQRRKLVAPAFQPRYIAAYAEVMADYAEQLQQPWPDGRTINIAQEMMRLTFRIVGKTLFDADLVNEASDVGEALLTILRYNNTELNSFFHLPHHWPTPRNRRFQKALARLDAIIYRLIAERRKTAAERTDLLSLLLQVRDEDNGGGLSDQEVRDEAITLFLAGYETTANALTWTWYLLAQYPEIYARVRAEVDHVLAGRTPTAADLPQLPYTLQVFKEAMRLYPPVHSIARQVARPFALGDYHLSVGTIVAVSFYVLHRRPDYFPDPERFDPERFTPQAEKNLSRYAYMPFSIGPRLCIGNHFAMMEGHLLLAALVQRVTFRLVPGQNVVPEPLITLRPRDGIQMTVERNE